jgi:putative spermidine/putrescine transport system permease protein
MMKSNTGSALRGAGIRTWRKHSAYVGVTPFLLLVSIFLLWPTVSVVSGAFQDTKGKFAFSTIKSVLTSSIHLAAFKHSLQVSAITSIAGAIIGALFAWAVSTGKQDGFLRRICLSASGVLAQFGGVMLTFAFLATFGFNGLVTTVFLKFAPHSFFGHPTWLYSMTGLCIVYSFFQIPLMFLVFLPTLDNLKPQWREASDGLGGSTFEYWRRVGIPVLTPAFLGSFLLLFANSFSAYATAASLISQGSIITPLEISGALSSETGSSNPALAKALSLGMVTVVIIVMALYTLLRKRVSRWEQ